MASEAVLEELEVLESIYPEELSKISDRDIELNAEPDDPVDGAEELKVTLCVHYTDEYPEVLPELSLKPVEGEITDQELESILEGLRSVGNDNLGMAMTFTLVSHLREQLSHLVRIRTERRAREEKEKERLALEEEEARTRGTPVTIGSFKVWKMVFDQDIAMKRAREEEERMKGLTPREREEFKRVTSRLTGRQLFERGDKNLEDDTLLEEGTVSVDASQYERQEIEEEQEDEGVTFSDSD
ncbi:RWD domain-containing protein [Termitomyces sp. T112]|nr:RWD domain-containing protein [Termitomyces sp. T112]